MIRLPKYPKFGRGEQDARVRGIAAQLGADLDAFAAKSCVVAGSNGKGSTATMIASILTEAGNKSGLFVSPHLFEINERFAIDRQTIGDDALDACWREVEAAADGWLAEHREQTLGGFEFLFLVAALWFQRERCECIVWEAGIGGRHDVTRLVRPKLAALTSLDLEHTELLGASLLEIALDKVDVCAPGGMVFCGADAAPFAEEIAAHCCARGVTARFVNEAWPHLLPLAGAHQRRNAALAACVATQIGASQDAIARGLAGAHIAGRLETINADPAIVVDVGHSPGAIAAALEGFRALHPGGGNVLVCGASNNKNAAGMIDILAPAFDRIVCTAARHKGASPDDIAALARGANPHARLETAADVAHALRAAMALASPRRGAIYVAGGLFLAAEAMAQRRGTAPETLLFF